jgi:hypothetical protein
MSWPRSWPHGHVATSYLRRRAIDVATVPKPYPIGYARAGWTNLVNQIHAIQRAAALAAGSATSSGVAVEERRAK